MTLKSAWSRDLATNCCPYSFEKLLGAILYEYELRLKETCIGGWSKYIHYHSIRTEFKNGIAVSKQFSRDTHTIFPVWVSRQLLTGICFITYEGGKESYSRGIQLAFRTSHSMHVLELRQSLSDLLYIYKMLRFSVDFYSLKRRKKIGSTGGKTLCKFLYRRLNLTQAPSALLTGFLYFSIFSPTFSFFLFETHVQPSPFTSFSLLVKPFTPLSTLFFLSGCELKGTRAWALPIKGRPT